jgi:hypothetical protein
MIAVSLYSRGAVWVNTVGNVLWLAGLAVVSAWYIIDRARSPCGKTPRASGWGL